MDIQKHQPVYSEDEPYPTWMTYLFLLLWLAAAISVFVPFARDTSAWNAVTLRVPGDQGNWWHVLVGAPFFLAYPMVWLRLRYLFSRKSSTPKQRRWVWSAVGLSVCATALVQIPFLLHLAGTSEWQRLVVLIAGFGIVQARTEQILTLAANRPGHIFNLGHGIVPGTPVQNVIDVVHHVKHFHRQSIAT